jgi:hypothetical protein
MNTLENASSQNKSGSCFRELRSERAYLTCWRTLQSSSIEKQIENGDGYNGILAIDSSQTISVL